MLYDIGELLKKKRKEKGLTLEQAGKQIGVSKVTYRDYELNNIKSARMDKLNAIADFLEISPEELFNKDNGERITSTQFKNEVQSLLSKCEDLSDQERMIIKSVISTIDEKK